MRKITALIITVALGVIPPADGALAGETLFELESRWQAMGAEISSLGRQERLERAAEFFATIAWADVLRYCGEASSAGPDLSQFLAGLVDGKLRQGNATTAEMLAIVGDPEMGEACLGSVVKHIFAHRDSIRQSADAKLFAMAFLDLADSGTLPAFRARQLERGAANLWSGSGIEARALRYSRSEDETLVGHGVGMLCEDSSSRPHDSLVAVTRELAAHRRYPRALARALNGLSACCGSDYFDFFLELLGESGGDQEQRKDILQAIGRSQDPRSYAILIAEYGDGESGIVAETHAIEDPARKSFYWNLWYATRLAEPGIIDLLDEDGAEGEIAVDLLDRASRFGLPETREAILQSMERWAVRRGGDWGARVQAIAGRFRAFPEARGTAAPGGEGP